MIPEIKEKLGSLVVVKRDGKKEKFCLDKLVISIRKAYSHMKDLPEKVLEDIIENVLKDLSLREGEVSSIVISDLIEKHIVSQIVEEPLWEEVAKRFVLGRIYNHVYGKDSWSEFDSDDLKLTFNALKVLEARYLLKNPETLRFRETPKMMFERVAKHIALPEKPYGKYEEYKQKFFQMLTSLKFMPNSPTLMNAGTKNGVLSACYVIPVRDAMATERGDGIMDALKAQALIQQQAGGTGFQFSELRPEGDIVKSTTGVASGPLSFMKLFDAVTDVIKQGGKRRGANMGILHIWHPDIHKFIKAKTGELKDTVLQNFNISVGIYDKFMEAVEKNEKWPLINPRKTWLHNTQDLDSKYYAIMLARHSIDDEWIQEEIIKELEKNDWSIPLHESKIITWEEALAIAEKEKAIVKWVNARELLKEITHGAWDSGDPGVVFIDEMNRRHPTWYLGKINATNPCGEQPLLEWESCNLGSIDVSKFVVEKDGGRVVDWDGIAEIVRLSIRFLDNVIDMNNHPLPQINEANKRTRKVGLGIMGLAHFLAKLGIPYDSPEAIVLSYRLAEWIAYNAVLASIGLAREKGVFPAFDKELYRPLWRVAPKLEEIAETAGIKLKKPGIPLPEADWGKIEALYDKYGIRNAAVLSIAPTGTISIIAGSSSSIEPIFALAFLRLVSVGSFIEIDRVFLKDLEKIGQREPWIIKKIAENGSVQELDFIDEKLKRVYKIAHDIDPIWHILHQAAWQAWVDSGVSKTINLRNEEPPETVDYVYKLAWKLHCKGITVYRDKSKSIQVLNKGIKTKEKEKPKEKTTQQTIEGIKEETRLTTKKLRIGKKELVAVHEEYAGGCPTCDV